MGTKIPRSLTIFEEWRYAAVSGETVIIALASLFAFLGGA